MIRFAPILAPILLAIAAPAQNLLRNGDFESTPLGWTMTGTASHVYRVESYDVTGNGRATNAVACTPDTTRFTVTQSAVPVKQGGLYEFVMDIASYWPNPKNASWQNDAGRFTVLIGGAQIGSVSLGRVYRANPLIRRQLKFTHRSQVSGVVDVSVVIHRVYNGLYGQTPRCYVDNLALRSMLTTYPYGKGCGNTTFRADIASGSVFEQGVYTGQTGSAGLMLLGLQRISVDFLGCKLLTTPDVVVGYANPTGFWVLKTPIPTGFRGPLNVQHLARLPNNTIELTNAVTVSH